MTQSSAQQSPTKYDSESERARVHTHGIKASLVAAFAFAAAASAAKDDRKPAPEPDALHTPSGTSAPSERQAPRQPESHTTAGVDDPSAVPAPTGEERRAIGEKVRAQAEDVAVCYNDRLARRPTLSGRIVARFDIGPDGRVIDANVEGIDDSPLVRCIVNAVLRWKFEKPASGGKLRVAYPFVFRSTPE